MPLFPCPEGTRDRKAEQAEAELPNASLAGSLIICRTDSPSHRASGLVADLDTHLAGRTANGAKGRFFAASVEVLHFHLHDVHHLLF